MRVLCRHGHYAFYPKNSTDVARFANYFQQELVREEDYFTVPFLKGLETFSLNGVPYKEIPSFQNVAGKPWEILEANGWVYSFASNALVPKESITTITELPRTGFYFLSQGPMIQAGSINSSGQRVVSFDAEYLFDLQRLRVREFSYG